LNTYGVGVVKTFNPGTLLNSRPPLNTHAFLLVDNSSAA